MKPSRSGVSSGSVSELLAEISALTTYAVEAKISKTTVF